MYDRDGALIDLSHSKGSNQKLKLYDKRYEKSLTGIQMNNRKNPVNRGSPNMKRAMLARLFID
jgi:hypothetical protein